MYERIVFSAHVPQRPWIALPKRRASLSDTDSAAMWSEPDTFRDGMSDLLEEQQTSRIRSLRPVYERINCSGKNRYEDLC